MNRILHHFSINSELSPRQVSQNIEPSYKPQGLWLSDEESEWGWSHWAAAEEWGIGHICFEVKVDTTNILLLENKSDLLDFTKRYGKKRTKFSLGINWQKISEEYSGILITPYIWQSRLDDATFWYYGWDCASGCIWNPEVIKTIKEVK